MRGLEALGAVWSVAAKSSGRVDCREIGQVELTDRSQRVRGTVLKVVRQGPQPYGALRL
jgi:hypothetical protein